ncbi:pentapeptide repeat-containing protein [Acetobacterium wieringae]|uniref:pentapeptide repeat-containing protein n=1 Tax=Acetobacterium wieringae TaxID=52694 RepID=UPI0016525C01|nr:pentapeptide repeat-containing protein [Acetobacterium wieringae]
MLIFFQAQLENFLATDSSFQYANFSKAKLKALEISQCDFSEATISECKLTQIKLDDVNFSQTSFFKTPLKGLDFTSCQIDGLIVSIEALSGAVVTTFQAAELAKLMGLIVR